MIVFKATRSPFLLVEGLILLNFALLEGIRGMTNTYATPLIYWT